jgi:hypothetical protein
MLVEPTCATTIGTIKCYLLVIVKEDVLDFIPILAFIKLEMLTLTNTSCNSIVVDYDKYILHSL